jgi:hypothetical protein
VETETVARAFDPDAAAGPDAVRKPVRGCDGCTLCCKVMEVKPLQKPSGTWCTHCRTGNAGGGCGIYETRPTECRVFICGYLWFPEIAPEWKPAISRLIISTDMSEGNTTIFCDPARPDAWRRQPYYAQLKSWAARELSRQRRLVVRIGKRSVVMLPDGAIDLGAMADDELILVMTSADRAGAAGRHEVYAVKRDAWNRVAMDVRQGLRSPLASEGVRLGTRVD